MRIDELNLMAFGPFTGRRLDFSPGAEGVHVVFGANEAGKSSALRAIRDALFGVPTRTSDNFLHPYDSMRIGFSLRTANGSSYSAIRLKRNKNTLLDPRSETPIDEAALAAVLGNVDREAFARMFGLDTAALRAGGKELATMQGDVGGALFAAAGGLMRLRRILEGLDQEAGAIFRPRGQTQVLNRVIKELDELRTHAKSERHSSKEFKEKSDELDRVRKEVRLAAAQLREHRVEKSLIDRISRSRRLVELLDDAHEKLDELVDVRVLREDFATDLREVSDAALTAETEFKDAEKTLARIDEELKKLARPTVPQEHWQAARRLSDLLGAFRKACIDLPGIRRKAEADRAELAPRIQRLRPGLVIDDYATLFISPVDRQRIAAIGKALTMAQADEKATAVELSKAEREQADTKTALEATTVPTDIGTLEAAMKAAGRKGDVEEEYENQVQRCRSEGEVIQRSLDRAGRWEGSLDQLRDAALPTHVTIDTHEAELAERTTELRHARDTHKKLTDHHTKLLNERDAILTVEGDLPQEADVAVARASRDGLWNAIQECWLNKGTEVDGADTHHVDGKDLKAVGGAYDDLVNKADGIVDRVRHEHTRVDRRARLESEIRAAASELDASTQVIAKAEESLEDATQTWNAVWKPIGVDAGTPREMREWLTNVEAIRSRLDAREQAKKDSDRLDAFITSQKHAIRAALEEIGVAAPEQATTLSGMLERCAEVVREQTNLRETQARLKRDADTARKRVDELTKQLETKRRELTSVKDEWSKALAGNNIPGNPGPTEADSWMTECTEVYARSHQLLGPDGSVTRIRHIERDFESFIAHVTDVLRQVGDPVTVPDMKTVDDIATSVLDRIERSKQAASDVAKAEANREAAAKELGEKRTKLEECRSRMAVLEREAGAEAGADLVELCDRSNRLRKEQGEAEKLTENLAELAEGVPIQEWIETVRRRKSEDLPHRLAELEEIIKTLDADKSNKDQTVGRLTSELGAIGAGTAAVDLDTEKQAKLQEIETHTREYARLWVASKVLRRAVDAYRERNQGDMLRVAGNYFARLTEGAFSELKIDYADENPVIVGWRTGKSAPVRVEAMSEGTTDQLFLALRLAYIDLRAQHHEPMPLILDDVLATYDDARAAATLKALVDVSRRTQVILFTHHRHLLSLAEQSVPKDALFIHDLSA